MVFSSIPFLYYFLPTVIILYFLSPKKLRNSVLLLASLFFYAWGEPKYIILMIISILLGYTFGMLIDKHHGTNWSKFYLALSIITGIGILGYFKYADFFINNFRVVTGIDVQYLNIALPIGISFYTFQILSYTIDVYRGQADVQKNIIKLATYVALFPQLIAGPIVRYVTIADELDSRQETLENIYFGVRLFIIGLAKKVLIANSLGEFCSIFADSTEKSLLYYWMYGIAFSLQIYFDFSGYSDMAIGLGRIFGFNFLQNFNYPYISKSITEFWRRWHISLGSWFRDYIYIPMGGNRVDKYRWLFNIAVVWMLTGFWHGAAWNFVLWGMMFAILLVIEKLWIGEFLRRAPAFIAHIYVLFFVMLSFVLFNAADLHDAITSISAILGFNGAPLITTETAYYVRSYMVVFIIAIIGSTPLAKNIVISIRDNEIGAKVLHIIEPIFLVLLFLLITAYLVDGSFNPFLYFRF